MTRKPVRQYLLWILALVTLVYAAAITFLNIQHVRTMPRETRVLLKSLQSLQAAALAVEIIESRVTNPVVDGVLEKHDVHVEYGRQVFPVSRAL